MATPHMTKAAEAKIISGAERMAALIQDGDDPSEALYKVACERPCPPGHIQLMAQAYNTGRSNHQRKNSKEPMDKTATFALADAGAVLRRLYPEKVKSAAEGQRDVAQSNEYNLPPSWLDREKEMAKAAHVKEASAGVKPAPLIRLSPTQHDRDRQAKQAFDLIGMLERERQENRVQTAASREKIASALLDLHDWFRDWHHEGLFSAVQKKAELLWGEPAKKVLDKVAASNDRVKSAFQRPWDGPVQHNRAPWSYLTNCLDALHNYQAQAETFLNYHKEASEAAVASATAVLPPLPRRPMVGSILDFEKRGLLDILSKMMPKEEIASEILPESTDKLRTKAYLDVTDPGHESKLRKIRTRSILTDLLANDEFLSAESPEKVTDLYNQLSHLSPRAGEQPVLMQALLRRYFAQGQVDPHDLDQLVGIEHKLKKIEEPKPATDLPTLPSTNLVQQSPRRPTQRREEAV